MAVGKYVVTPKYCQNRCHDDAGDGWNERSAQASCGREAMTSSGRKLQTTSPDPNRETNSTQAAQRLIIGVGVQEQEIVQGQEGS